MATTVTPRIRPRPAHPPGTTVLTYTPNGKLLVTAGQNSTIRAYVTGSDEEPHNIDDTQESNTAIVASDDFCIAGSEDGTVCMYSLQSFSMDKFIVRCTLPIRDLSLSPNNEWVAVASDEITVKVVNVQDTSRVIFLRDHPKPVKHVNFSPSGIQLSVSGTDGVVYIYSLGANTAELDRKVDGVIRSLEADSEACSRAVWHPDGRAFAAPTATRDIQVVSHGDGEKQRAFKSGHSGDITALAWSFNGALLATAGTDRTLVLWETATQTIIAKYDFPQVTNLAWHPVDNRICFTTSQGEVYIFPDPIPPEKISELEKTLEPAPFFHDPLKEVRLNLQSTTLTSGLKRPRAHTPDSLDEVLGSLAGDDEDFIEDDDGAGYVEGHKRSNALVDDAEYPNRKRLAASSVIKSQVHPPFQPSSTPWRGNRRYLCLNLIGFIWTVDQDTHHTVTVEFYDRSLHRDFHFTDPYLYDKACLTTKGALFSCPSSVGSPSQLFYRPHETWTTRSDFRVSIPKNETILAIALSSSYVVALTDNYIRIYTLFGVPIRLYRPPSLPAPSVTCTAHANYLFTVSNGPLTSSGAPSLVYSIENIATDKVSQLHAPLPLHPDATLQSIFFSDAGDPCIYDSDGVLLVLLNWRVPDQARWMPLLDTRTLDRVVSGRKREHYWPVAVAAGKFHAIILKGADRYPYFPRPLLSEFEFSVPINVAVTSADTSSVEGMDAEAEEKPESGNSKATQLEQAYVLGSMQHALSCRVGADAVADSTDPDTARLRLDIDKTLLQLLVIEVQAGEDRSMKALDICRLFVDRTGRIFEAAAKIAERWNRDTLRSRIEELAERRLHGEDGVDNEEEDGDVFMQ